MFVSSINGIKSWFSKKRLNSEGEAAPVTTQPGQMEEQESESSQGSSTIVSSCSTVLTDQSFDSRVTVFIPEDSEEVPPDARLPPFIQAHIYGQNEYPPSLSGVASDGSTVSECSEDHSAISVMSEYDDDEDKENRGERREEEGKMEQFAQGDYILDEILDDARPLFSDVEEEDEPSRVRQSRSQVSTLEGSEKDCFGYEFERLSAADFNSLSRREGERLSNVGIDYTPSGAGHSYKRDSYMAAPAPPPHRPLSDIHSISSSSSQSPAKPIPIDGVIGSAGYHRSRVQLRDSASASPHSFTNRRSLQQLNNSGAYANLSGSFHEFPLTTSCGGGETRRPPIPQRSSIVSESTVSSASPVVMMRQQQYAGTPVSARRGLELHNGYGVGGGARDPNARFSAANPAYYDEMQHHHHQQQQQQQRMHPSSHRSSKAHRVSASGGIAVTSASGHRGMVTSISHHDGYPNGGYTMEEYGEEHSGGSSGGSSFERDQHIRSLEQRLREVEQQLNTQQSAGGGAATGTPTFARSARHHAQSVSASRGPPTPMDAAALADKDAEISKLQKRLEQQQVQYEEEIRALRTDTESVSGEHSVFKNKLARMERELEEYKERAARADSAAISAAASEKIEEKESELSAVRAELERLKRDKENMERRQEQIEFLQKQNETLSEQLDEKEGDVKTLTDQLVKLQLEHSPYQQSCSSGSTPLADEETRSLVVGDVSRTPQSAQHHETGRGDSASVGGGGQLARVRQYTKAHSTLGASGIAITPSSSSASPSITGTPKSSGLAKSLSNYHLDAAGRNELPPALSVMMRKTQKLSVDSRALAHCIKECAEKTMRGEQPDTNLLVGRMTSESMSDSSDCEMVATDCTKMSLETAEKTLRQQEMTLGKLHSSLEAMRGLLLQVYQRRFHDEMERGDESCRVQ